MPEEKKKYHYYTKVITLPNGKRKWVRGKTRAELNAKLRDLNAEVSAGVDITNNMTVSELGQMYVDLIRAPKCKQPLSLQRVKDALNGHVLPYIGWMKVRDVKPAHILDIMTNHAYPSRGCNSQLLSDMRGMFNFAVDNGVIAKSPVPLMYKAGGNAPKERVPLTRDEANKLLDMMRADNARSYLFTLIALSTGMRTAEIFGLRWDCVDLTANTITVKRQLNPQTGDMVEHTKTEAGKRILPIPPDLHDELVEVRHYTHSLFVLPDVTRASTAVLYTTYNREFAKYSDKLGKKVHAHLLRHTYATWLVASGMDVKQVQYLLGHSSLQMTLGLYAHYQQEARREETADDVREALKGLVANG